MSEKIYSVEEIAGFITPLLNKYGAQKAVLFGSYARNEADKNSDIDVMVTGGKTFEPADIFCIADELYRIIEKDVDVYEESEINEKSDLYKNIMREGIALI